MNRWLIRLVLWIVERSTAFLVSRAEQTSDSKILALLANEWNSEIDTAVSLNPATDPETLCALLERARMQAGSDEEWRQHILQNAALPREILCEVMRTDDSEAVRVKAACVLTEKLSSEPSPPASLVSECQEFLTCLDARADYPGVKPALSKLRSLSSRVGLSSPSR